MFEVQFKEQFPPKCICLHEISKQTWRVICLVFLDIVAVFAYFDKFYGETLVTEKLLFSMSIFNSLARLCVDFLTSSFHLYSV